MRPSCASSSAWERLLADYGSTGVTLREHPLELMRPGAAGGHASRARTSSRSATARAVRVAGLVVARQRPATAKGVTFMLLEDEHGTINLIVPPPVHDRCRLAVRGEPLVIADGRLERREGVTNVLVHDVRRLERATCRRPRSATSSRAATWSSEAGEDGRATCARSAPAGHGFGRRRG